MKRTRSFPLLVGNGFLVGDIANHKIKRITITEDTITSQALNIDVSYPTCLIRNVEHNPNEYFITDKEYHRVIIYNETTNKTKTFGKYGTENGEFNEPTSIALCGDRLYVADSLNYRIQIFDTTGTFQSTITIPQQKIPFFPHCILTYEKNLYVIDNWGSSIFVIDSCKKQIRNFVARYEKDKHDEGVVRPTYACIDNKERLFVCDNGNNRIVCIKNDKILKAIYLDDLNIEGNPIGIDVKGSTLFFTTTASYPHIYSLSTHQFPL